MALADLGVAAVIVLALTLLCSLAARDLYRRRHPPPGIEDVTARLEAELDQVNRQITGEELQWVTLSSRGFSCSSEQQLSSWH